MIRIRNKKRLTPLAALLALPLLMAASAQGCAPQTPPGPVSNQPVSIFSQRGGVYILSKDGKVYYVGQGELSRRSSDWARDEPDMSFRVILRADSYNVERGAEQIAWEFYKSKGDPLTLNKEVPMTRSYRYYQQSLDDANAYVKEHGWSSESDPLDRAAPDDPAGDGGGADDPIDLPGV